MAMQQTGVADSGRALADFYASNGLLESISNFMRIDLSPLCELQSALEDFTKTFSDSPLVITLNELGSQFEALKLQPGIENMGRMIAESPIFSIMKEWEEQLQLFKLSPAMEDLTKMFEDSYLSSPRITYEALLAPKVQAPTLESIRRIVREEIENALTPDDHALPAYHSDGIKRRPGFGE